MRDGPDRQPQDGGAQARRPGAHGVRAGPSNQRGARVGRSQRPIVLERGSATVAMLGIVAMVLVLTVSGLSLASAMIASHQARTAADLAALTGAAAAMRGEASGRACAAAMTVASANHARLTGCEVRGEELVVQVAVRPATGRWGDALARARAGPGQR